jgi:hypothetical protein
MDRAKAYATVMHIRQAQAEAHVTVIQNNIWHFANFTKFLPRYIK